ncbi:putative ABC transporter permease protein [Caldilinea aerophila DSM 14535 = NBRC 104270]|uniref:Putative ABC transporter permease protein n=1 Tax=Caldilinea aerophila (strain DSM 14535 / JCM 11387 / NBRC 104270 / STL-6-O1) TaxID=926550 RepID=I0I032_CALAS|nr:putative ABC transporter permease protein [Caldilinea aerophila DSM 14535 = NBRC 104270]
MAPLLLLNLVVIITPSLLSVRYAFTEWTGIGPARYIGLANFQEMLADPVFYRALWNNVRWTLIFLTVPVMMGLLGASLLSSIRRGQILFRTLYFIPYVIASVVNAYIWKLILNPVFGIGPWLAERGIPWLDIRFFARTDTSLYAVAFVDNWHFWGFLVVLYLAAMHAVDPELYEAARIEGANRWHEFWHVTLPGIRPTLVFTLLMIMIWSFLVFDYIYLLTGGGPAHSSEVLATLTYSTAFYSLRVGYATAIALTMTLFSAIFIGMFVLLRRLGWEI